MNLLELKKQVDEAIAYNNEQYGSDLNEQPLILTMKREGRKKDYKFNANDLIIHTGSYGNDQGWYSKISFSELNKIGGL